MMKKVHSALVISMILLTSHAFSQTTTLKSNHKKEIKATRTYVAPLVKLVRTSLNYGRSNADLRDFKKQVLGAQVGATFQAGITPAFSVVAELYLMMKGGKLKANNPLTFHETTYRLYPVELPVLARFHFGRFYANAGPSISYHIYGSRKMGGSSSDLSFKNISGGFKRWDAAVQAGAGYVLVSKQKRVALEFRYVYGLTNMSYDREMYNRNLMVNLVVSNPWKTNPFAKYK